MGQEASGKKSWQPSDSRWSRKISGVVLWVAILSVGCFHPADEVPESPPGTSAKSYIAVSGGGWRAHTAQAGWTIGLLDGSRVDRPDIDLRTLFADVEGIASNSGGSWFMSMLVYSPAFRRAIEDPNASRDWGTSGYLYQQQEMLGGKPDEYCGLTCPCPDLEAEFLCKISHFTGHPLVWTDTIREIVFKPFDMAETLGSLRLGGDRQDWAKNKALILAATLVTDKVVLTDTSGLDPDQLYYQATASPSVPAQVSVTPVSFSSVPSGLEAPDFFSAGDLDVIYRSNGSSSSAPTIRLQNDRIDGDVFVLSAAAASSAAGGAEASHDVLVHQGHTWTPWTEAYEVSDLAPAFRFDSSPIVQEPVSGTSPEALAEHQVVRLADGGFLDNSAVAHLVDFLQKNDRANDFNIIAFDNVQEVYQPPSPAPPVPIDIAYLFGVGRKNNSEYCAEEDDPGTCVEVPVATVLDGLQTAENPWTYPCPGSRANRLTYTRYSVTTVENKTLGIEAGSHGTLHVFASVWPLAATAPERGDADFLEYNQLLKCIHAGMTDSSSPNGTHYFQQALLNR